MTHDPLCDGEPGDACSYDQYAVRCWHEVDRGYDDVSQLGGTR